MAALELYELNNKINQQISKLGKNEENSPTFFDLKKTLAEYHINYELKTDELLCFISEWYINLYDGNPVARTHFEKYLKQNPEMTARLIFEIAQTNTDMMDTIKERAAFDTPDNVPNEKVFTEENLLKTILLNLTT